MTDSLHETRWQRPTLLPKTLPPVPTAAPAASRHGAVRGILFGSAIMLPLYATAALIYLLWA